MTIVNNPQVSKVSTSIEQNSIEQSDRMPLVLDKNIQYGNLCRVKYHPLYSKNHPIVVEGKLDKDKKYPVILDTGASVALFVNDIHINENNLVTQPLKYNNKFAGWGTCLLPELHIGEIILFNWPCYYRRQHAELQLFGLPLARDKAIIVGLPTLQEFKYIAFDGIKKEVEFSPKKLFEVKEPQLWEKYPLTIEDFLGGNAYLFVKIPIAGEEIELQLDTGSGNGLSIKEDFWKQMQQKIRALASSSALSSLPKGSVGTNVKLKQGRELYPYIGLLDCEKTVIPKLDVGNRTIKNAKVSIFPEDSPLLENCEGLIGMQYFQDTVMVLDFERNLMWVKSPQNQQKLTASSL
jgi:hypothetical protein